MKHILRFDIRTQKATKEDVPEEDSLLGGRGLISVIFNREVNPLCHPLGSENKLVIASGLLAGTNAPSFGRISIGAKSPLTNGIKEANAGGTAAQKLDRLGIRAIIVEGKPNGNSFTVVKIDKNGCEFHAAENMTDKNNYELVAALHQKFGDKVSIISIGKCGERRMAASTVAVTDIDGRPSRHAARGGLGAVMGSKGLKAIVIDDSDTPRVKIKDTDNFQKAIKSLVETLKADKGNPHLISEFGTPGGLAFMNTIGSMPTRNYRSGSFEQGENLYGETIKKVNTKRGGAMHGCMPGCVIQCSIVFNGDDGNHLTSAIEYETLAMMGSNLGIADLDAIAKLDRLCDELGIDTIEAGSAIAQAVEAGLIKFGDYKSMLKSLEEVGKGTHFGRIIGQGAAITAKVFGLDRIPAVLGQAIPAHDPRVCKPVGVTYATSAMGADHTAGIDYRDFLSSEGQVTKSKQAQIFTAAIDSVGYCILALPTKAPIMLSFIAELLNARYGLELTGNDVLNLGIRTIREELAFNQKAGIDIKNDPLPDFLKKESLSPQNTVFDIPRIEIQDIWNDL